MDINLSINYPTNGDWGLRCFRPQQGRDVRVLVGRHVWLCDPHGPSGSSDRGILQAKTLDRVAIYFSRGSSRPRDWSWVFRIAGRLHPWGTEMCSIIHKWGPSPLQHYYQLTVPQPPQFTQCPSTSEWLYLEMVHSKRKLSEQGSLRWALSQYGWRPYKETGTDTRRRG